MPLSCEMVKKSGLGPGFSDVNKTTSLKTKAKTKTKTKTKVIAADNVIINGKVAIIVFFYSTIFCMFSLFFHHNFLCVVCI